MEEKFSLNFISIIAIAFALNLFIMNSCDSSSTTTNTNTPPKATSTAKATPKPTATPAPTPTVSPIELEKIEVTYKLQDVVDGKQKLVVFVTNKSRNTFTGDLSVLVKSLNGTSLGWDVIYVEELKAGAQTYSIIWIKPADVIDLKYEWSKCKFDENATPSEGVVNVELTEKVKKSMSENFGDADGEKYATSWWKTILDIQVLQNGSATWIEIKTNQKSADDRLNIMNAALNYQRKVVLKDAESNYLTEKSY